MSDLSGFGTLGLLCRAGDRAEHMNAVHSIERGVAVVDVEDPPGIGELAVRAASKRSV